MVNVQEMVLKCGPIILMLFFACSSPIDQKAELAQEALSLQTLSEAFIEPPMSSRPGAFWCWLNGDVTKASITRDLEEMKAKGMGRAEIWDVEARNNTNGAFGIGPAFLSDESVDYIQHALSEGKRLGIRIGMVASSGWNAGGSWVTPEWAAKALYSSELEISGPQSFSGALPFPELPEDCPMDENGKPVFHKEVAVLAIPNNPEKKIQDLADVIVLTEQFDGESLAWEVPAGDWTVLRFVCSNTGQHLIVPSPNSDGLFIDFFDPKATQRHLSYILGRLGITKENAKESGLGYFEFDSMELDEATAWTNAMDSIFYTHHGYDVIPHLPAFAGWDLPAGNDAFLYDFKKTVSDQLIFSHYVTGRDFLSDYGIDLVAEAGGPGPPIWDSCPVDALKALGSVTIPRGEFWHKMWRNIFLVKEVASAAHIYGLGTVDAESFTTWRRWRDSPHDLKKTLDRAFCEGLNSVTIHTFANTRPEFGLPGRAYHAGIDINPTATWWEQAGPFMDYMSRCSYLLDQGTFVADVAYYYGDAAPKFFPKLQGDSLRPRLPGLSAAYDFDVVNTDVILNRMAVQDGKIVFPDGLNYRLLVLPNIPDIPERVITRVEDLIASGAKVLVQNPEVAARIEGNILTNNTIDGALAELSIAEDCSRNKDIIDFIHRKIDGIDLYFVTNKTNQPINERLEFRASSEQVEYWDPVSSEQFKMTEVRLEDGISRLNLSLPAHGSAFIVFTKVDRPLPALRSSVGSEEITLTSPWKLFFPENWGAPASVDFPELISWTDYKDEGIHYFSGTAVYENKFNLPQEVIESGQAIQLDLGEVYDVAEVLVNGKSAGTLWTHPYQLNVQDWVQEGENKLEVKVTNLWINRIIGDLDLPEEGKFCNTNRPLIEPYERNTNQTLQPRTSGLLGPVAIRY